MTHNLAQCQTLIRKAVASGAKVGSPWRLFETTLLLCSFLLAQYYILIQTNHLGPFFA